MRTYLIGMIAVVSAFAGCSSERPSTQEMFNRVEFVSATPGDSDIEARALRIIGGAETSCFLAAETFTSEPIASALVAAQGRGVDVQVVGDADLSTQAGFALLARELQPVFGQIPMRFGDGPLSYNPELVDIIDRAGEHNRMTHNFLVCDERQVLSVTGGFGPTDVVQTGIEAFSFYMGQDFADEFTQLFGGVFASTLSSFNGPLKSITDNREHYDSDQGRVQIYFGPQERLIKRVVDHVYAARASVYVVAEELTSSDLTNALRYKAEAGFDVQVVVAAGNEDVDSSRYAELASAFRTLDNASIGLLADVAVNAVIIDSEVSPIDGARHAETAMFLSEPLLSGTSVLDGQVSTARASDAFCDANMFVFNRTPSEQRWQFDAIANAMRPVFAGAQ